jgi:outer membrane murein-binding lipoprotein Lpp
MQLLTAKFNQIATAIDATNAQIAALQAKLSELQEHQQQLLSVEQACQSALAQVDQALMMLHHVDPSQVEVFQIAIENKFASETIGFLPESPEPAAEPTAPEPTAPDTSAEPEIEPAIDVEVTTEPAAPIDLTAPTPTADIEGLLNKLSIQSIRKLAAAKGASGNGTRAAIAGRRKKLVTESEVRAAG